MVSSSAPYETTFPKLMMDEYAIRRRGRLNLQRDLQVLVIVKIQGTIDLEGFPLLLGANFKGVDVFRLRLGIG